MVRFSPGICYDYDDDEDEDEPISKRIRRIPGNTSSLSHVLEELEEGYEEEGSVREEGEGEQGYSDREEEEEDGGGGDDDGDEELEDQPDGEKEETVRDDGSIPVILTDPDVLDCPICLEPLTIPVFQCENGHIACTGCSKKTRQRCPSCSLPIGYNRCRAVEKIFESIKIGCINAMYGCKEMVKYLDKSKHEESCIFAPCSCPMSGCNYVNNSFHLYAHFGSMHPGSVNYFTINCSFSVCLGSDQKFSVLMEKTEGRIFIVKNHLREDLANAVSIIRIAPTTTTTTSSSKEYEYVISVRDGKRTVIKLQSVVDNIPVWIDDPPSKNFLLVPNHCKNASQQLKLEIHIWE